MKVQGQSLILCFVVLLLSSHSSLGQTPPQTSTPASTTYNPSVPSHRTPPSGAEVSRTSQNAANYRMQEAIMRARISNSRKPGAILPIVLTEEELTPKERKVLEPAPEDLKEYAEFLRQSGSGIFRLMRVDKQTHRKVVSADALNITGDVLLVGGGAHYSFSKKNHNADKWSDISWGEDWFHAGVGGDAVGVLAELGNTRLEDIGLDSKGVDYLAKLTPVTTEAAAEQQFQLFEKGVTEDGMKYALFVPWKLDTTYVLRSISYGRSDLLVAFRAVRQDQNGSLIILWKKLKSYATPNLKKERKP
ncbi:MAG TPA: hypothetical protein PLK30_20455 [Blastocatellia bacterium]|nr:hypothetical protein [Blastocatellia bacterium]